LCCCCVSSFVSNSGSRTVSSHCGRIVVDCDVARQFAASSACSAVDNDNDDDDNISIDDDCSRCLAISNFSNDNNNRQQYSIIIVVVETVAVKVKRRRHSDKESATVAAENVGGKRQYSDGACSSCNNEIDK
jgi:hypothetical protein